MVGRYGNKSVKTDQHKNSAAVNKSATKVQTYIKLAAANNRDSGERKGVWVRERETTTTSSINNNGRTNLSPAMTTSPAMSGEMKEERYKT